MPDAWDDDWIQKADSSNTTTTLDPPPAAPKLSKAERRAKQAEFNRQIWEDAEKPEDNFFLKTQGVVPLKSEFKPAMKVLSRKPVPKQAPGTDPAKLGQTSVEDDEDDEDEAGKPTMTPEERLQKTQREREEKQKAYEERRRQLFGKDSSSSAISTAQKRDGNSRNHSRGNRASDSRPSSAASNKARQLYDPNENTKPESLRVQKIGPSEMQPVREPKAPDGSGRRGFGFAPRGGRGT